MSVRQGERSDGLREAAREFARLLSERGEANATIRRRLGGGSEVWVSGRRYEARAGPEHAAEEIVREVERSLGVTLSDTGLLPFAPTVPVAERILESRGPRRVRVRIGAVALGAGEGYMYVAAKIVEGR